MAVLRHDHQRKVEAYDAARALVKTEGNTRAFYVLQRDAALAEVERLQTGLDERDDETERRLLERLERDGLLRASATEARATLDA